MQIRISGVLKVIGSFFSSTAATFEVLGEIFVAIGDPCITLEALTIILVIWWRGNYSFLLVALTVIFIISVEREEDTIIRIPSAQDVIRELFR